MNDDNIKQLLTAYVNAEMDALDKGIIIDNEYVYSKKYEKRIRRMMWSEKYFGNNVRIGYAVRRIAMIVLIILGLMTCTEVTAHFWGVSPWKMLTRYISELKMDRKSYIELNKSDNISQGELLLLDNPEYIPEGYNIYEAEDIDRKLYLSWKNEQDIQLLYYRSNIDEDSVSYMDSGYDTCERISIEGYQGYYYHKEDQACVSWEDSRCIHTILSDDAGIPKEELVKMAKSMYRICERESIQSN